MKNKTFNKKMVLLCGVIGVALIVIAIVTHFVEKADKEVIYINHIVKQGETVWSIANKLDLNEDLNKTIYDIRKYNNIVDCGKLIEGQVIKVREVK